MTLLAQADHMAEQGFMNAIQEVINVNLDLNSSLPMLVSFTPASR
jgi:hypothetical protein